MGDDFWKYGASENRREIEALTQYLHEQGLVERKVEIEELFHASTVDTAKI
jgi:4,5-dihydroxyphthalate decarboxylase